MSRSPQEIAGAVCDSCVQKVEKTPLQTLIAAVLGGAYIGFGGLLATLVTQDASTYMGAGVASVISGLVFSIGLILVVLAGAELFTGNSLIAIPLLQRQVSVGELLRNWGLVYLGNFIGALTLVGLMVLSGVYSSGTGAFGTRAVAIAAAKTALPFAEAFTRGILCNWLVCLGVWLAASAKDTSGKIAGMIFPVTAFVALGFEHSVANMYLIPAGILLSGGAKATWMELAGNLVPVTLGNVVGGGFFVATLYWYLYLKPAQPRVRLVVKEKPQAEEIKQ